MNSRFLLAVTSLLLLAPPGFGVAEDTSQPAPPAPGQPPPPPIPPAPPDPGKPQPIPPVPPPPPPGQPAPPKPSPPRPGPPSPGNPPGASAPAPTATTVRGTRYAAGKCELEEIAAFPNQQVTGVTVSRTGRIFVNFPYWSDTHTTSVAEILPDDEVKPYPDIAWNSKNGPSEKRWLCVQSVYVDDTDALWVLDPAAPKMGHVIPGGPKLVKFDLHTNRSVLTISFDESIAPKQSYLNDVRVDTATGHAFITESGMGAIIVVDLKTGKSRRLLEDHASTKAVKDEQITVDGFKLVDPKSGKAPEIHADGIALDQKNGWLYFHPLTGTTLFRIKTADLLNESLTKEQLFAKVEDLGKTPKPDGMLEAPDGSVYLAAFEQNAISRFDPDTKKVETIIADERLQWPDTMAWGPDGNLLVTTSQIHRMPQYHNGESKQRGAFQVFRLKPASSPPQRASTE
ncbi:MAG TPA: L-dopachrome tautomerase-related protein [Verrucomicrobiales bacterium]|nr:L-dopachrome tautomerase-related protein [Verrucomicrobiales bacterium]